MEKLIERSYKAIQDRGLITENTKPIEFIEKIIEETKESKIAYYDEPIDRYIEEITDIATVCIMQIHHLGYDFIKEFEKVVEKNENRSK